MEKNGVSTEKILIVSRTKMRQDRRCIGGIDDKGGSYRLLKGQRGDMNSHCSVKDPFQIGEEYEIEFKKTSNSRLPFKEDVIVRKSKRIRKNVDIEEYVNRIAFPWEGSLESVFDGFLKSTSSGSMFISEPTGLPERSAWFWYPDKELKCSQEKYYEYLGSDETFSVPYVGEFSNPIDQILKGMMVRLSLSYWWDKGGTREDRCYLQLSGWY